MYCREDLRKLKRITLLWDYIREVTEVVTAWRADSAQSLTGLLLWSEVQFVMPATSLIGCQGVYKSHS